MPGLETVVLHLQLFCPRMKHLLQLVLHLQLEVTRLKIQQGLLSTHRLMQLVDRQLQWLRWQLCRRCSRMLAGAILPHSVSGRLNEVCKRLLPAPPSPGT